MEPFNPVLLQVWREACRHIHISESAPSMAGVLSEGIPVDMLFVLEVDRRTGALTVKAAVPGGTGSGEQVSGPALDSAELRALTRWMDGGRVQAHRAEDAPGGAVALLCPRPVTGAWLAGPLRDGPDARGVLLLRLRPPADVEARHVRLMEALVEPFSVALENDHRVHQLDALRAAAEADKQQALRRLGRDALVDTIVGEGAGLKPVMERVDLVARSDIPVLIFGETGSGKEVIARAIHSQSQRAAGPFIRVNCAAISPELIDSELFGHEKGAFTGAVATRRGWFERADQGTLLLDEIGDLPLPAQVRLLRVLQEGTFERVGGEQPIKVSVRIVAATHADLPGMVQNGQFREDLWYRVSGFHIIIPPLRERREDIPDLARHFLRRASRRFGIRLLDLSPADLALLVAYDWPGNVRELASVMDRAAILGAGETLEVATALGAGAGVGSQPARRSRDGRSPEPGAATPVATLDQAVRAHIETALTVARGRIEGDRGVARLLDVNPHTLRARMRRLGIDWARFRE